MSNIKLAYAYGSLMAKTATGVGALVGGAVGAAGAGEDNRAAGAALGATLGTGANLVGIGYTADPLLRGIVGDKMVDEAIASGNKRFANTRFMNNRVGRYLGRTANMAGIIMSPEYMNHMQQSVQNKGYLKTMFSGGKGVALGQFRKGLLGVGAGLAAAGLARAGISGSEPEESLGERAKRGLRSARNYAANNPYTVGGALAATGAAAAVGIPALRTAWNASPRARLKERSRAST